MTNKTAMASYINRLFNTPFFQNKFVLYGSLFIVLLSILRHLANRNINAVILMALIGLVMSYFSKNMIVVLLTAFASVFLLEMTGSRGVEGMSTKEGAENKDDKETPPASKDKKKGEKDEEDVEGTKNAKKKNDDDEEDGKKAKKKVSDKDKETVKEKEVMTKLSPASYDGKENNEGGSKGSSDNRIDYASTLEQAYDNIENIIGEDGVRGLTDQTKSLMNQQKQLMDNMKDMGPLLKSAEGFMKQVTGGGGIGGITEMLKGFATPGGKPASASDKK